MAPPSDHPAVLFDVDDALDAVTSLADAERSKPHPDLLRPALDEVGTARAVFVGDATNLLGAWDGSAIARLLA